MGRKKFLGIVLLLSLLLIVPVVFSLGLVNVSNLSLFSNSEASSSSPLSSSPAVFVDPDKVIDEYLQPPASTFYVHVNVSDVTDLFAWQVNMTFDPSILSVNDIVAGEFLFRTVSENKTSSADSSYGGLGFVMNVTDNTNGNVVMAESILEDVVPGSVAGIDGNGRLVSVEFLVVGYGCTWLNFSLTDSFRTTLLNSTGHEISLLPENVSNGYFRNKTVGDVNSDETVNILDILKVKYHWYPGPPVGTGGYDRNVDINDDTDINILDLLIVKNHWGHSPP